MHGPVKRKPRLRDLTDERWRAGALAARRWMAAPDVPLSKPDSIACADVMYTLVRAATENGDAIATVAKAIRTHGEAAWQVRVDLIVYGRSERECRPGQRTHRSLLAIIGELAAENDLAHPAAFLQTCLENHAKDFMAKETIKTGEGDELRRAPRRQVAVVGAVDAEGGEERFIWDDVGRQSPSGPYEGLSGDVDPADLPNQVIRVLHGSVDLAALMVRLGEAGHGPLVSATDRKFVTKNTVGWYKLERYLSDHVALGMDRPRWNVDAIEGADNHARSWQARFHEHECFLGYFDDDEIPPKKDKSRATFDQHGSRFRAAWRAAKALAGEVTDAYGLQEVEGERVPFSLDPPTHPTLEVQPKKAS